MKLVLLLGKLLVLCLWVLFIYNLFIPVTQAPSEFQQLLTYFIPQSITIGQLPTLLNKLFLLFIIINQIQSITFMNTYRRSEKKIITHGFLVFVFGFFHSLDMKSELEALL